MPEAIQIEQPVSQQNRAVAKKSTAKKPSTPESPVPVSIPHNTNEYKSGRKIIVSISDIKIILFYYLLNN